MDVAVKNVRQQPVVVAEGRRIEATDARSNGRAPAFVPTFGDSDRAFKGLPPYFGFCANVNGERRF